VRVKATGARPGNTAGERELFSESTSTVLVFERGGVIRLAAAVTPGQLLFLSNEESKREVVAQVVRKRAHRPTECYVELEFTEPAPKFWGMEFSAATALLPKEAKEIEAAELVASAETTGDEPGDATPPPSADEILALKKEVEALRGQLKLMQTPGAAEQAATTAALPESPEPALTAEPQTDVPMGPNEPAPTAGYVSKSLPIEPEVHPAEMAPASQQKLPAPVFDFSSSLPKRKKRSFRAKGNFTPGFRSGALRLALLTAALVITMIGAAWYKHWLPWNREVKKISVVSWAGTGTPTAVAPGAKTTAPGTGAIAAGNQKSATEIPGATNAMPPGTAAANVTVRETAPANARAGESSSPAEVSGKPVARGKSAISTSNAKRSTVRTPAVPAIDAAPTSGAESVSVPPKLIRSERAVASLDDLRDFETGSVIMDAVVDQSGDVISMNVLSGPPSLRAPAKEALKHYKYEPALRNGKPVPARVTVKIQFHFEP
jgi:hypothetical protein